MNNFIYPIIFSFASYLFLWLGRVRVVELRSKNWKHPSWIGTSILIPLIAWATTYQVLVRHLSDNSYIFSMSYVLTIFFFSTWDIALVIILSMVSPNEIEKVFMSNDTTVTEFLTRKWSANNGTPETELEIARNSVVVRIVLLLIKISVGAYFFSKEFNVWWQGLAWTAVLLELKTVLEAGQFYLKLKNDLLNPIQKNRKG